MYKEAAISEDLGRQMDGDNDFGEYRWQKKEQQRREKRENDRIYDLILGQAMQ